ncbi:MAG: hypothetical protein JNL21_38660 [Myxococcales bacterium]|nr:hypothetical protein [Myxococcales bacterium]
MAAHAEDISVERLVVARGVNLKKQGALFVGTCPLHDGSKAKVRIDSKANTWSCSACGIENGGPVEWMMRAEGVSKKHATELLKEGRTTLDRRNVGPKKGATPKLTTVRTMGVAFTAADSDEVILGGVADFYATAFMKNHEGRAYLESRGLRHPGLAEHFRLGLSNRTLGLHIPKNNRVPGRQLRERLTTLGVLKDSGHEVLRGCLVVPLFDISGNVINLYGRRLERARLSSLEHVWTDETRKGLINPKALRATDLIVTASITDAITCWAHGAQNVTAIHGLDGPTDALVDGLKKSGQVERVFLVFRRTKESDAFAKKLADTIGRLGIAVHQGLLPHGLDVGEFAASVEQPDHALLQIIRSAAWLAGSAPAAETKPTTPAKTTVEAVVPAASATNQVEGDVVRLFDDRRWRVRGLNDNTSPGTMRVNLLLSREGTGFHVDTFDIYSARHRVAFIRQASTDLGLDEAIVRKDMGTILLQLEEAQGELLRKLTAPKVTKVELTAEERKQALGLLRDPKLLDRTLHAFEAGGVVGERDNLLLGFLAVTSRKLRRPLGVMIQSSSAAGKSSLMEAILSVVPEEDRVSYSAMTGQSLFYAPGSDLRHKVLSIAEEEGAARASYSLKLLQSEGSLTIASTGKEPGSGRLVSQEYKVQGPVALLLTTTSIEVDEELMNRCVVLTVDESPAQTRRIHERQRQLQTLEGVIASEDRTGLLRLHQNAQRLLRPLRVVNPHVEGLTYGDLRVRARRDHAKLLTLIEAVAFVHQHQRPVRNIERDGQVVEYIEAAKADVELAERLVSKLGVVGVHDLPPQTVSVLQLVSDFVAKQEKEDFRFTRRQVREFTGIGNTQAKVHLRRLADAELLVVHRAPAGRGVVYELAYQYDTERSDHGRPSVGPRSAQGRGEVGPPKSKESPTISEPSDDVGDRHREKRTSGVKAPPRNGAVRVRRSSR